MGRFSKILLILTFLILPFQINAQDIKSKKVIKKEGWTLPSISDAEEGGKKNPFDEDVSNNVAQKEKILIELQIFKLKTPWRVKFETVSSNKDSEIYSEAGDFVIYLVNDKVFAYGVRTVGYSCSKTEVINGTTYKGTCGYLGCSSHSFYLDEDGDGKFEARYYTWELPLVPDWVKK